jgi:predicted subunit of tRNA(5-methylaminomethyl-2-thiouridylate) methyltransferase
MARHTSVLVAGVVAALGVAVALMAVAVGITPVGAVAAADAAVEPGFLLLRLRLRAVAAAV